MKDIYKLELLEVTFIEREQYDNSGLSIRRVPGGWIFTSFEDSHEDGNAIQSRLSSVFVPYSEEFRTKEEFKMADPKLF